MNGRQSSVTTKDIPSMSRYIRPVSEVQPSSVFAQKPLPWALSPLGPSRRREVEVVPQNSALPGCSFLTNAV